MGLGWGADGVRGIVGKSLHFGFCGKEWGRQGQQAYVGRFE